MFLDFHEDFAMPLEENEVNGDRKKKKIVDGISLFLLSKIYYSLMFYFILDLEFNVIIYTRN